MVIERAGNITATSNSEGGERTSTLLISFFFFSTAHFFFIFTGPSQVRLIWKHSEQQRPARLLRDKERIHSHSNSCANEAWQ